MIEQQYTCPFCHKDYTRFTISEHYGCGVEPFETTEEIEQKLDAICEEVAEQESNAETINPDAKLICGNGEGYETLFIHKQIEPKTRIVKSMKIDTKDPSPDLHLKAGGELVFINGETTDPNAQTETQKPEPKKRGRKPKAK